MTQVRMSGIKRREFTTKGPDPTVVVEWTIWLSNGWVRIQEFQDVYRGWHVMGDSEVDLSERTAKHLHTALEDKYHDEMQREEERAGESQGSTSNPSAFRSSTHCWTFLSSSSTWLDEELDRHFGIKGEEA